jgi:opacity protein-like surface antigen
MGDEGGCPVADFDAIGTAQAETGPPPRTFRDLAALISAARNQCPQGEDRAQVSSTLRQAARYIAIAVGLLSFAGMAHAEGAYVGIYGGANLHQEADTTVKNTGIPAIDAELHTNTGWLAGISAGYQWHSGFALEGELTYRQNELDRINLLGTSIGLDGTESALALLGNAVYRLENSSQFTPYIGVGIGAARLALDADAENGGSFKDSATSLAFQAIAGVSCELTSSLALGLEYRYFRTADTDLSDRQGANTTKLDTEYAAHDVLAKLVYRFH